MGKKLKRLMLIGPLAIAGIVVFIAIGGLIVQQLWNWLLPPLFGWREVTFWQALGLLVLCRILFGGLGAHGRASSNVRRRVAERREKMTPEEQERLRQRISGRFGLGPDAGGNEEP